jgi:hypothetical protein
MSVAKKNDSLIICSGFRICWKDGLILIEDFDENNSINNDSFINLVKKGDLTININLISKIDFFFLLEDEYITIEYNPKMKWFNNILFINEELFETLIEKCNIFIKELL